MKFDYESIMAWLKARVGLWKLLGVLLLLFLLVSFLTGLMDSCGNWWRNRSIEKLQGNINALVNEANHIGNQVNQDAANYVNAKEGTNEARNDTNMALDNYNAVINRDYNGANYSAANSARCRAYPKSNGC